MAMDCYAVARMCNECALERIKLRKNAKEMTLFPRSAPLEFVSIDIFGQLLTTKRANRYLFVVSDRYSKLYRTFPLKRISAVQIALAFVYN